MADDFFGMLGKSISGFFGNVFKGTGNAVESAKLKKKINVQKNRINKTCMDLGRTIYEQYSADEIEVDEELQPFLDRIDKSNAIILDCSNKLASLKDGSKEERQSEYDPEDDTDYEHYDDDSAIYTTSEADFDMQEINIDEKD